MPDTPLDPAAPASGSPGSAKLFASFLDGGLDNASGSGASTVIDQNFDGSDQRFEFSGNQDVDAVLIGSRWTATSLTYSFPTSGAFYSAPYYDPSLPAKLVPFNAAQQTAAQYALTLVAGYTNLTFTQVTETADTHGAIRLAQTSSADESSAEGNFPGDDPSDGDVWLGRSGQPFYLTPQIGNWGQATLMHEIGHALGLKHGHQDYTTQDLAGFVGNTSPHFGSAALPASHDGQAWSVMTYRSDPGNYIRFEGDEFNQPQTYMQDDIAALQYLYGANFTTNSTDTVYTFSPMTGEMFVNGVSQGIPDGNRIFRTVWDGNGNDTYDFSNFTGDETIDLTPGGWSTCSTAQLANNRAYSHGVNYAPGNIANALLYQGDLRSLIENAVGGSGNDRLFGNQADNHLTGNGGNDYLDGGTGADIMTGGTGDDTYVIDNPGDVAIEQSGEGNDSLITDFTTSLVGTNFENVYLYGSADLDATGNTAANILSGNDGHNVLTGGGGDDIYYVGVGDTVIEAAGGGIDTIVAAFTDSLAGLEVENLILSGRGNIAGTGNTTNNILNGNTGNNNLDGGAGNDTLYGGDDTATVIIDSGLAIHDTRATALAVDASAFSVLADSDIIGSTTAPHATILATGDEHYKMYSFAVSTAGVVGTFDIDNTVNLDSFIHLFDATGTELAASDDSAVSNGGSGSLNELDSFLQYAFTTAGTYYLEVSTFRGDSSHAVIPAGASFDLNISLAGNAFDPGNNDILIGGAGNDSLDGGTGTDRAVYDGLRSDYAITATATGFTISDLRASAPDGIDQLSHIEELQFSDVLVTAITANNSAPSANASAQVTDEDVALHGAVSAADADNNPLTYSLGTGPAHGTLDFHADGTYTYTPFANYHGADAFTFTANDGAVSSSPATVSLTINSVNDNPVGINDAATVLAAGPRTITLTASTLLANDSDLDGDSLSLTGAGAAAHGTTAFGNNGTADPTDDFVTYTPVAGYFGPDSFTYSVSDGHGGTATATVNLTVQAAAPTSAYTLGTSGDDVIDKSAQTITQLISGVGGNDSLSGGAANDTLNGGDGNDVLRGGQGADTLTGGAGADQFLIDKADMASGSDKITDFTGAGNGDVAGDDKIVLSGFSASATISQLSVSGSNHTYKITDGAFTGTFIAVYAGTAVLQAGDYIFLNPVSGSNHAPVGVNDAATVLAAGPRTLTLATTNLLANDTDADGNSLTVTGIGAAGHGSAALNANGTADPSDDFITYTPTVGYAGADSFTYTLSDGHGGTATATVNVTVEAAVSSPPAGPVYTTGTAGNDTYDFSTRTGVQTVAGNGGNDVITTGSAADTINGGAGNDTINGGTGKDTLTGGGDQDTFVFTSADGDKIVDFSVADDTIALSKGAFGAITEQNATDHILMASQFAIGAAATTIDQRVIYNASTGALYYDADGSGAGVAVQVALLAKTLALTHDDFVIWA